MSVFFNGRLWTTPATASMVDDSAMYNTNLSTSNILAIVGKSGGGKPATALHFGSAQEARAALRSGSDALKACEKAFDPSAQVSGPSEVVFVRVNPAVQAALSLYDGSAIAVIDLLSEDYGIYTNGIKVKIETASTTGKMLTTQFGDDYYSDDNIYRNAFSVVYSGTETSATISITASTVTLQAGAKAAVAIDLSSYSTISQLADRISAIPSFTATVLDENDEKPALNGLDFCSAVSIKTTAYTATAHLQAIVDWINSVGEGYISATRKANVGTVPANIAFTYLTGGSDGVTTTTEWQAAFDALQSVDVQWVVPLSPLPAIHAMTDTHCTYMSNIARMERRAIVGGDVSETDAFAIAAAKSLNSDRTSYTHLGFYAYNDDGDLTLYPPYVLAAQLAGAFSGVNPGTALTNKTMKVNGWERKLRNPTDTDALIKGGVLAVEDTPKGYKVVKSITTWLTNTNYNRVEVSTGGATDYMMRSVREILDDLRGAKGTPLLLAQVISRTDSTLAKLAEPEPTGIAVLAGDTDNPAYKGITATLEGDVVNVTWQASPVIPANYILCTAHLVPYSGSASL